MQHVCMMRRGKTGLFPIILLIFYVQLSGYFDYATAISTVTDF
jgi:hypothetical protein